MSFQALEEAFESQTLTISALRKFRKEHLQNLCKAKCIKISHNGKTLKEDYVQALFTAIEPSLASKQKMRRRITRDDGSTLITLSPMVKLIIRKDTKPMSPEIVLDNPAMDIDTNSPNLGGSRPQDVFVGSSQYLYLTRPSFEQAHAAPRQAIPSTNAEVLIAVDRKRKRAIMSSSAKEPKGKKQKINKEYGDGRSILVRAFDRRGEESHVAEAEIMLDSDGTFAVEYLAAKLVLKGTLYIIHPRNHYLYEPVSPHIVSWDEIQELQDFSGVLMVTFNEAYSKTQRGKHTIEYMC